MKKIIVIIIAVLITALTLTSCESFNSFTSEKKLKIVTTVFPQYDWVKQILGDEAENAELTLLLNSGVDLHSYQPTASDIIKVSNCDMFIYLGGNSDDWVDDMLKSAKNKDMVVINLIEVLGDSVKEEEIKEGMEDDHNEEEHEKSETDGNKTGSSNSNHKEELDEHIWLSLKNAQKLCAYISDKLCDLDSKNSDTYRANLEKYNASLSNLDNKYREAVENSTYKTLVFGDRFPFRYLTDDYGIDYFAAFSGCSSETQASFDTIIFLANKVNELSLKNIMVIENSDKALAQTIISNTKDKNQKILSLNSLQSITSSDISEGTTYLSVMEKNLEVLKEALN